MSADQDKVFLKTFAIIMVIIGGIAIVAFITAYSIGVSTDHEGLYPEQVAMIQKRTDPVYDVVTQASAVKTASSASSSASNKPKSGKQVFKALCHTCHVPGLMGAPKVSDKAAWQQRLSKGIKTLYDHAIHGFKAMPPKGGNPALSNKEVKAAVDFILQKAGVK